ncbi:hypothetical protein BX659_11430 [Orenia metallireducens]|uniref:Uncharacterized protein n=2 Tax=Orenia metallireducens TaxID=1413210 RepID=A0A285HPF8_9FIRM|nr:hypothetical protein BX659_11430 [Orenia metallireducens]SNY37473.1 hypothetical protein SAMN06265827_12229 [Orenia metallireducens]
MITMKIWKLTESRYGIKERLTKELFRNLISIRGVEYNKSTWRIEFDEGVLDRVEELLVEIEVIEGEALLERLYRLSKFQARKGLMRHAVMIHEAKDYIYMILSDGAFEILEEYEGTLLVYDSKLEEYATELLYFKEYEKLRLYQEKKANFSIADIIEVLDSQQGSILKRDPDAAPYLFLDQFQDLKLSDEQKEQLFKKELSVRNVTAFNLERLAEEREINREFWYPTFVELVEKEIIKRKKRIDKFIEKLGIELLFNNEEAVKLGAEIEELLRRIDGDLQEAIDSKWVEYYLREKERRIYGIM